MILIVGVIKQNHIMKKVLKTGFVRNK